MKVYQLPSRIDAILFDIDSTLYTCDAYATAQIAVQIERFAAMRGNSFQDAEAELEDYRSSWSASHGGKKLSLGNTLAAFGIPIEESVRWREALVRPEDYLQRDEELFQCLSKLGKRWALAVVTNNPASIGLRTLRALGVAELFQAVVGLDTCGVSKPHEAPFRAAADALDVEVGSCLAVGDRYDIDVALPLAMGMGGILVDGVVDVYTLPTLLAKHNSDPKLSGRP